MSASLVIALAMGLPALFLLLHSVLKPASTIEKITLSVVALLIMGLAFRLYSNNTEEARRARHGRVIARCKADAAQLGEKGVYARHYCWGINKNGIRRKIW